MRNSKFISRLLWSCIFVFAGTLTIFDWIHESGYIIPTSDQLSSLFATSSINSNTLKRPNILLLFPDQWRFDYTNNKFYNKINGKLRLPNVDYVAKHGISFTHVIVPSPLCGPSRSCLITGKQYDKNGVKTNADELDPKHKTFYQLMHKYGYYVMTSGKDDLTKRLGVGKTGTNQASEIGFDSVARTGGKKDAAFKHTYKEPYTIYLNQTFGTKGVANMIDCYLNRLKCIINGRDVPNYASFDEYVNDQALNLVKKYYEQLSIQFSAVAINIVGEIKIKLKFT